MPLAKADVVSEIIQRRRSVRSYKHEKPNEDAITRILEAAQWGPTAYNAQECRFVVVRDDALLEGLKPFAWGCPKGAPTVIVVCADGEATEIFKGEVKKALVTMDIAMAAQNMLLMAESLELGACVVASFSEQGVAEFLGLPSTLQPVLLVSVGHRDKKPSAVDRKHALSEITTWRGE
jgi:nitroreductase